jgi:DNA-3-methyladenine glycosylase II
VTNSNAAPDQGWLTEGLDALSASDPAFAAIRQELGDPPLRSRPQGFATLLDAILGQQVSTASANAIKAKLQGLIGPATPESVLAAGPETLRAAGFSRQKIAYALDLATAITEGRLDLDHMAALEDEAAIEALVAIKGIGRWTAEIYLLFALHRRDIWPAADLALAVAVQRMQNLPERPVGRKAYEVVEHWRPWRGAAAHLMWKAYHHFSRRDGAPI